MSWPMKRRKNPENKYHARKITIDGIEFDSQEEGRRYLALKSAQQRKEIIGPIEVHVPFLLVPNQFDPYTRRPIQKVSYEADFVYSDKDGKQHVEDVKPFDKTKKKFILTRDFIIKRKLMLYRYGILVELVDA